jgi:hypothetical protein
MLKLAEFCAVGQMANGVVTVLVTRNGVGFGTGLVMVNGV